MDNVNWSVFSPEEQDAIKKLVSLRDYASLACGVLEMTREKEIELQKLLDATRPINQGFESKVMKDYVIERQKAGLLPSPQTPAEEKELQEKLDMELLAFQEEQMKKSAERKAQMEKSTLIKEPVYATTNI